MDGRRPILTGVIALCLLSSCNSVCVSVAPTFPQEQVKKVAVLEFDHKKYSHTIIDKVSHGVSTAKNPGKLTAGIVSSELEDWGRYTMVKRYDVVMKLRREKIEEPGVIYHHGREAVGKLLGADAVVIGNVDAYESAFFLMVQSAKVIFTARCMDVATGQEIWKIQVNMKEYYTSEERLVAAAMKQAVEKLRALVEKVSTTRTVHK